jgi:hypothetical protein
MAKLLYVMNASLDGYIADEDGNFDWGHQTRSTTPSSTICCGRSAPTCTGAGCMS